MVVDAIAPWAELVLFTADDLTKLPDDAWHYELVQGRLVRMSPSGLRHGGIGMTLGAALRAFAGDRGLGLVVGAETGFHLSRPGEPDTVLAPDAAFLAADRVPPEDSRDWVGFPHIAPDLVLEVASPSQHRPELAAKARLWLKAGVRLVWIVWPAQRQVDVWEIGAPGAPQTLSSSDELTGGDVLPGFSFPLATLWR
jgi:Uma2 family endonuclease